MEKSIGLSGTRPPDPIIFVHIFDNMDMYTLHFIIDFIKLSIAWLNIFHRKILRSVIILSFNLRISYMAYMPDVCVCEQKYES